MTATPEELADWVDEVAALTTPDSIHWVTGRAAEIDELNQSLVDSGTCTRLNEATKPNSFWCASDPRDVARVEDRTYIASVKQEDAGPTNSWVDPVELKKTMTGLYSVA